MHARCLLPLLLAATSAGCFDDRGVVLEIDVGDVPATAKVELFITTQQCGDPGCDGITPRDQRHLRGEVWDRDADTPILADVNGHKATFRLEAANGDEKLSMLIAVGRNGNTPTGILTVTDLMVPLNSGKVITASLGAVTTNLSPPANQDGALLWTNDNPKTASCLMVAHADSEGTVTRTFIVPQDDLDCDGMANTEDCVPNAYLAGNTFGPETDDPTKLCTASDPTNTGRCFLGTIGCAGFPDATCRPQIDRACIPTNLCTQCAGKSIAECLKSNNVPVVQCSVPSSDEDTDGCATDQTISNIVMPRPPAGCDAIKIAAVDEVKLTIDDRVDLDGVEIGVSFEDKKACQIKLTWRGGTLQDDAKEDRVTFLKLETENGSAIVPLIVHFSDNHLCGDGMGGFVCTMLPNPDATLWGCLSPGPQ